MIASDCDSNISVHASRTSCPFCGKLYKSVKIHISKAHPEEYRSSLICNVPSTISVSNDEADGNQLLQYSSSPVSNKNFSSYDLYQNNLKKWDEIFSVEMDEINFNTNVSQFVEFLSDATDFLPGPKNPAKRYIEARKKRKLCNDNNKQYKNSTNPQRASKNERLRRKAQFEYEKTQFEYFYQRWKAVRKVLDKNAKSVPSAGIDEIESYFRDIFEISNPHIRESYETYVGDNSSMPLEISADIILKIMNKIAIDTSPGPDKFIMKSIKKYNGSIYYNQDIELHVKNRLCP